MNKAATLLLLLLFWQWLPCPAHGSDKGQQLYRVFCAQCHGPGGQGFRKLYPPLVGSNIFRESPEQVPCLIRFGIQGDIRTAKGSFNQRMPAYPQLGAEQLTDLVNHLTSRFAGNRHKPVTREQVSEWLKACH